MLLHAPWAGRGVVEKAFVLDLFAGTGALGLEALSRGAGAAEFIERDRDALAALRANIGRCEAEARTHVTAGDATDPPAGPAANLVFMDPPYGLGLAESALQGLVARGRLAPGCMIVAEGRSGEAPPAGLTVLAERTHGAGRVVIGTVAGSGG